jgi:hypothetical protein
MGAGSNNIVTDGLVYCLDAANKRCYSGSGTTGVDLVEGGAATLVNGTAFSSDKVGVFAFDGTDDRIDQDWSFTLGTGDLTIEFWVKMEGWIIHSQGANVFLSVVDPDVHEELQFGIENSTAQRLAVYLHGGSNGSKTGDGVYSWNLNQWYHLVATRISSTVALYRDGVSLTVATGATNTGDVAAISTFLLGNQYKSTQYKHDFQGEMGPIRIYNKGLTAAEVSQNYEATKSRFLPRIAKSGLVGSWDAGDPECYVGGNTCKDTANGTASTLENMDVTNFNSANGGYWEFDGTDEYIQCSTDSILQPESCGVEAWVWEDGTEDYLPLVVWKTDDVTPAVWTSYHDNVRKPIIYMNQYWSAADFQYFDDTAISVAGWHHVVFNYTYDDISTAAFYVDGVSISKSGTTYNTTKGPATDTCKIGATGGGHGGNRHYKGSIALVRIYNRALSVAEILDNYNKTKGRFGH